MRKSIWNKKIPTLLGMFFLVFGIGMTSLFVQRGTNLFSKAGSNDQPVDVRVSNVTDTAVTISFTTPAESIATISYGKGETFDGTATDIRDQQAAPTAYKTHFFTLSNLTAGTPYSFVIYSGGTKYQDNEQSFHFATGPQLPPSSTTKTVTGKIITASGEPTNGALVYISSDSLQQLSVLSGIDGVFSFSLLNVRTKDGQQQFIPQDTLPLLLAASDGSQKTHSFFMLSKANPLPTVILGNDYDFTSSIVPLSTTPESSEAAHLTFPLGTSQEVTDVQILTPKTAQIFSLLQPTFSGTAKPNTQVQITIQPKQLVVRVVSSTKGEWTYRPTTPLTSGAHTITIRAKDLQGVSKTVTTSFTIQPIGAVQGIHTQAIVPTPTRIPLPTRTPVPTRTPYPTRTPTAIPSPTPTRIPTPTSTQKPTAIPISKHTSTVLAASTTDSTIPTSAIASPTPNLVAVSTPVPTMLVAGTPIILSLGFLAGLVGIIGTVLYFFSSRTFPL